MFWNDFLFTPKSRQETSWKCRFLNKSSEIQNENNMQYCTFECICIVLAWYWYLFFTRFFIDFRLTDFESTVIKIGLRMVFIFIKTILEFYFDRWKWNSAKLRRRVFAFRIEMKKTQSTDLNRQTRFLFSIS